MTKTNTHSETNNKEETDNNYLYMKAGEHKWEQPKAGLTTRHWWKSWGNKKGKEITTGSKSAENERADKTLKKIKK